MNNKIYVEMTHEEYVNYIESQNQKEKELTAADIANWIMKNGSAVSDLGYGDTLDQRYKETRFIDREHGIILSATIDTCTRR